jgi:hypothetical protein
MEEGDGTDEDDTDEVSQTTVLLVNEKDLEGAACHFMQSHSRSCLIRCQS